MGKLFEELKRRKVFRVAAVYTVAGWGLAQVAAFAVETFSAPQWVQQMFVVFLILGFPLAILLAWAYETTPEGVRPDRGQIELGSASSGNQKLLYATFGLVLLLAGFQFTDRFLFDGAPMDTGSVSRGGDAAGVSDTIRLEFALPEGLGFSGGVEISPDGSTVVFASQSDSPGGQQIWLRSLDDLSLNPIPGTGPLSEATIVGGQAPRFSPDSDSIVFQRSGRLETVSLTGGAPRVLLQEAEERALTPAWGDDGMIYYVGNNNGGIWRVPAVGGDPEEVIPLEPNSEGYWAVWDVFPGSSAILFRYSQDELAVASLDTGVIQILAESPYGRYLKTGHLLYADDVSESTANFLAAPFDIGSLELTGPASVVLPGLPRAGIGVSNNGTLVHLAPTNPANPYESIELVWVTRSGVATPLDEGWQFQRMPQAGWSLSPDGTRVAYQNRADIWIKQLPDGPEQRFTFTGGTGPNSLAEARHPAWTPDGQSLTYVLRYFGSGPVYSSFDIWQSRVDGSGDPRLLIDEQTRGFGQPMWSSDGDWLILRTLADPGTGPRDIVGFRPGTDEGVVPLVANAQFGEQAPELSPDGRWLAYASDESGREEVFIRPFPDVDSARWQVSTNGGIAPLWSSSSDEVFYVDTESNLVSAQLSTGDTLQILRREILFNLGDDYYIAANNDFYDVAPDDQRFLLGRRLDKEQQKAVVVLNFFEELRQRLRE